MYGTQQYQQYTNLQQLPQAVTLLNQQMKQPIPYKPFTQEEKDILGIVDSEGVMRGVYFDNQGLTTLMFGDKKDSIGKKVVKEVARAVCEVIVRSTTG